MDLKIKKVHWQTMNYELVVETKGGGAKLAGRHR